MERRLAAVLAVDVVGYSRKLGEAEGPTLASLHECRAVLQALVASASGHVINTAGDSVLSEFPSVVEAVRCASYFQATVRERNSGRPSEEQIEFRAGVHQGELVHEGIDAFGDGINIAVRLEGVAAPGGIAVSDRVRVDIEGKLDLAWEDGGEFKLKNIARPLQVWFNGGIPATSVGRADASRASVAVLPFHGDPDDQTFCNGLSEDVIDGLSRFRSLYVSGRSSSFSFQDSKATAQVIGRKLGVAYLVEGNIRRASEGIRVSARLVDTEVGTTVWAERYDRSLTDFFEVQDEITGTITATLAGRIESDRAESSLRKPPLSLAAYDLFLKGVARFRSYDAQANDDAIQLLSASTELDPQYAVAYSYLSLATLASAGYAAASKATREAAVELALKGVDLSPQDATCQRLLGQALLYDRNYELAEARARRAVRLNPNDPDCLMSLGYLLVQRGQAAEALAFMDQAVRLNPFHPVWYHVHLAAALFCLGRYRDCLAEMSQLPHAGSWLFRLAAVYSKLDRQREALEYGRQILEQDPGFSVEEFMRTSILLEKDEDRVVLRDALLEAELPQ